jgi:hypothetical protein
MNLKKYNSVDHLLFPLILSKKFIKIIKKIDNIISHELLKMVSDKIQFKETFIDVTEKDDMITFITSDKVNKMISDKIPDIENKCWNNPQRVEIKLGRFIFRLLGNVVQSQDIENFIIEYKSIVQGKRLIKNFKIIEGDGIKKWYSNLNYSDGGGNLKDSCMRHNFCQLFFDIYTHNPEKVKLLILLDDSKEKILGRSLLWYLDKPSGEIFMDRVYFSKDFVLNMFINHAIKNGWLYKLENMDNLLYVIKNNNVMRTQMSVSIKKEEFEFFPFVDNMCFYDPENYILTNDPKYLKGRCKKYYDLCDHTGGYEIRTDFEF